MDFSFLATLFVNPKVVFSFTRASSLLRKVEEEVKADLIGLGQSKKYLAFPHLEMGMEQYWQRNFFSILFISIFQSLDFSQDKTWHYTRILHFLRGIVTATDNILDLEDKGALKVQLKGGRVLPNIISLLLQDGLLHTSLKAISKDSSQQKAAWAGVIDALYAIGEEESEEEAAIETSLSPEDLLNDIHRFRGANLLLLAFIIPEIIETENRDNLKMAMEGIFDIGMALQILDDASDFKEDLERRNHNLLRSWIIHNKVDELKASESDLQNLPSDHLLFPDRAFPKATAEVMALGVGFAMQGFGKLHKCGHPLDVPTSKKLMQSMFKLRGLAHLWEFYLTHDSEVSKSTSVAHLLKTIVWKK